MIIFYRTRRPTWGGIRTLFRFLGTSVWLGLVATLFAAMLVAAMHPGLAIDSVMKELLSRLGVVLIVTASAKMAYEAADLVHVFDRHQTPLKRLAILQTRNLAGLTIARFALGTLGGIILPLSLLSEVEHAAPVKWLATMTTLFAMSIAGELLERTLFFMTAVAPRMPGAVRT